MLAMAALLQALTLLALGTLLVGAEQYVTQEQLRELLAINEKEKNELRDQVKLLHDTQQTLLALLKGDHVRASRHAQTPLVAFTAALTDHLTGLGKGQNIRFDHVITNVGNGYIPSQGTFTAPVAGMYVFSTTLLSFYNHSDHFQFMLNGNIVYRMYVGGSGSTGNHDTSGSSVTIHLQQGDIVSIQNVDVNENVNGGWFSLFTGYLLKESDDAEIVGK